MSIPSTNDRQTHIREIARRLLSEGRVDVVVGYQMGATAERTRPAFIRRPDDTDGLVWNAHCETNLANYIPRLAGERIGIVAKGCDSRSIVNAIQEGRTTRDAVYVIGVPCDGLIDRRAAERTLGREVLSAEVEGDCVRLRGRDAETTVPLVDLLCECCAACVHPNPVLADEVAGEPVPEGPAVDTFAAVDQFEAKDTEERWRIFAQEASKCIRCYACKNACPLCFCDHCFVENTKPQWIPGGVRASDVQVFLVTRALHAAGRCVDCGACDRACPMGVRLRLLNKKMQRSVQERFGHEPGMNVDDKPALSTYSEDDAEDFMKH